MIAPLSNRPKIKQQDVLNGYVNRYFVRNTSSGVITEVDNTQYQSFKKNPRYQTLMLEWTISGNAYDFYGANGTIIYGTRHKNLTAIDLYERQMRGLSRVLRNPLEYFQGLYNKNTTAYIQTSSITPNIQITIPPIPTIPTSSVVLPSLVLSPTSLTFIVTQSSSVPSNQLVNISELNDIVVSNLTYTVSGQEWVSASLQATSTPATMSVSITSSLVPTGSYSTTIFVSSSSTPISSVVSLPVNVTVVKFDYETLFMDYYRLPGVSVNLDNYGPYTYNGGSSRWAARDFNLINITSNTSGIARLSHHIPMDRTKVEWYMYRYNAPATNVAGLALAVPTGSTETDYIGIRHLSDTETMDIVFVSSSGATTTLTSVANTPLNTSTGTTFTADILNNMITVFSGSVQIMSASVPESIQSYLTDASRTIGFYSSTTNQAGGVAFGQLDVTRLELQPYTSSVPVWNNTVMHLDAANTSSYIETGEWQDLTGFFNSASAVNAVYTGSAGGAFYFDGPDRMALSSNYSMKPEFPFTFCTWVKVDATGSTQGLFTNDLGLGSTYRGFWINLGLAGNIGVNFGNGGTPAPTSRRTFTTNDGVITLGEWQQITAVVNDSNDMSVYINAVDTAGTYAGTATTISYTTTTGSLGYTGPQGQYYLTGSIGMASLFGNGLTEDEITLYFNKTRNRFGV